MNGNTTTLTGNLTGDPELKFTPSGAAVASFTVAVNHRVKRNNEWVDDGTTFWRVTAWKGLAETVAGELRKGQKVTVIGGSPRLREYDRKDGSKGASLELTADEIATTLKRASAAASNQSSGWGNPAPATDGVAAWTTPAPTEQPPF